MKALTALLLAALLLAAGAAVGEESPGVLRVCADPNDLPLSHRNGQGFENRIAELFARDLGWRLEYAWFPQGKGFIRNTLKARDPATGGYRCDLVTGLPVGFDQAATTRPYYRSTWALVYVRGKGLDGIHTPHDLFLLPREQREKLRFGGFDRSPAVDWLREHHLLAQLVPHPLQSGDPARYPGELLEKDLAAGDIDIALVWGPIAGYYARDPARGLALVPFPPDDDIHFDYAIAMGVRPGETAWKERVERFIAAKWDAIQAILADYGVPRVDDQGRPLPPVR